MRTPIQKMYWDARVAEYCKVKAHILRLYGPSVWDSKVTEPYEEDGVARIDSFDHLCDLYPEDKEFRTLVEGYRAARAADLQVRGKEK